MVPYLVSRTPSAFYELLAKEGVTVLSQTPSAFRQLIRAEAEAENKFALSLRYVICAGEALELQSLKPWFDLHGDDQPLVVNMYGITETTVHSMYRPIRKADLANGSGSVIGVAIPDLQIHLLNENLQPVPPGVPGEICVGGAGVARGYLNRPELTRERFIPDPFSSDPEAILYRSGDLAQISATGEMEYLGRMDHQVKIRGFRIELGEIESALNQHPAIRESAVVVDQSSGVKRLAAYLVATRQTPTITELRETLAQKLPDYMIPATFTFLGSLPLTTNGKLDRRALPAPDHARPSLKDSFVAATTDKERTLATIWSEVLEISPVGIHDNFFELGGDSIRSIAVLSRAAHAGLHLTLQQLFQKPTIAQLSDCAASGLEPDANAPIPPFALISSEDRAALPATAEDAYPLTTLQLGMFFHNELDPLSAIYHDVFSYRIESVFDPEKLRRAMEELAARHPVLRTSFHLAGFSKPLQVVHSQVAVPFTVEDLRGLNVEMQDQNLVDWVEREKRNPFDRSTPPFIRFHTQQRSERSFQLILSFHHVCLDGWSLAAVLTELLRDYANLLQERDSVTSSPQIGYRDFVALEIEAINSESSRGFWASRTEEAGSSQLPRWPKTFRAGGHEQVRGPEIIIDPTVLAGLRTLAQRAGVPLKTVLLAAHQKVMGLLYGQSDVTSGLVCNGRPENIDGEKLVGLFLNTLPFRLKLKDSANWLNLIEETFVAEQEIIPHRRFPMAEIQRLNGGKSLFETAFDFVHFHVYQSLQHCEGIGFKEGHYFEANNLTTYTTFMLNVTSTELELHIDYDPNSIGRQQIEEMCGYYLKTLQAMVLDPLSCYDSFSPLSESERQKLLVDWNATERPLSGSECVHEWFELRAQETPEAVALVFGHERITYRELNERAARIASRLIKSKAGPGRLVGIFLERSIEMVAGLLGILKAGSAYVPLDPGYPKERLAQMIDDAQLSMILTERRLHPELPDSGPPSLFVDQNSEDIVEDVPARSLKCSGDTLAYVIYTSGSTGRPKAVQIPHRAVVNALSSIAQTIGITHRDNLVAITTLSFDIAALEFFLPLMFGGTVTLASREQATDGTQLSALLRESQATIMQGTPATWRLLLESGWPGDPGLKALCGGESLSQPLAQELLPRVREVWNMYGPTETTIWSTACKVMPEESISIGRPLANTQIYILDAGLHPVPVGTLGEICIGGLGVAHGYLSRPKLTEAKFIINPFVHPGGQRIYKTGDLGRFLPDGPGSSASVEWIIR